MDKVSGFIRSKGTVSGSVRNQGSLSGQMRIYERLEKDYNKLTNKPSIEDITLEGNKYMSDFGDREITNFEIKSIIDRVFGRSGGS